MGIANEAMQHIRAGLCDRIDQVAREFPRLSLDQLCATIDDIRHTAREHGLDPLAQLARGLEAALADGGQRAVVLPWLDTMRDAAGCERLDAEAATAYLAAINLRMAG